MNIVQQSGEHLLALINNLLDISKIEVDRMKLSSAPIHLPRFLDDIASIIHSRAAAKRLTFTLERLNTLPTWVEADETRLRQVLLNLLDNAIKFTEAGRVTLRVSSSEFGVSSEEPGTQNSHRPGTGKLETRLRFEVEDTGLGISPDQLERIFQPFEQAEDVTRWITGAGLGLSISRQLVRLMGGELHVESPPFTSFLRSPLAATEGRTEGGPGSLFWFEVTLPVIEVAEEVRFAEPPDRVITGYRGARATVLVVDDVPSNRAVVVDLLEPLKFEVIEAADGQQALHLAQELRPDLILMDRWMPVLDGFEAVRQMRQMPELEEMVVIAVSASVSAEDQAQGREVGIDAFLPKPVNWPRLAALLEAHLQLEWEYKEQGSEGAGEPGRKFPSAPPPPRPSAPLVPPSQEEMAILYELALWGDMRAIQERAAHLETLGEQYVPFANRLRELARAFEERAILALVEQYYGKG
jgi:CheY-like chemotaxis protein